MIAAVSVNPWGDAPQNMRQDAVKWRLVPEWRWGIGNHAVLARVWHDYAIGVQVATRTIAGVTVREIAHTEATYLVDASGHERAVFVYPFRAADVLRMRAARRARRVAADARCRPRRVHAATYVRLQTSQTRCWMMRPHDGQRA